MTTGAEWQRDAALIDGVWVHVADSSDVHDPYTQCVIGRAASTKTSQVDDAVAAAAAAGETWGARSGAERGDAMDRLLEELRSRRDSLAETTVAEVGAPLRDARVWHVDLALRVFEDSARMARELAVEEPVGSSTLLRRPAGVVACITPWNYPFYQLVAKVAPALAAGCSVVAKPAELTPLSAYLFADAVMAADLPRGVFNLVPGPGSTVGARLASHPDVSIVSFTGSTAVGRDVAVAAARNLNRACLELGGKSASIVLDDADLCSAVRATVDSAMLNAGQTCSAWTRLLVPASRYEEALEIAAERANGLVLGDPSKEHTQLGPLISGAQRDAVLGHVEHALDRGARLVAGGLEPPTGLDRGHFVRPTVLADVDPADPISQEEVFGPVLVVHPYDDDQHAIAIANGTRYGLAGAVWSADEDRAYRVASRLETGQVDLNGAEFNPGAPFGGWKDSGIGRELGRFGLEEFTELTAVQR